MSEADLQLTETEIEDKYFPVPLTTRLSKPTKPPENPTVIKMIIQGAVKGAFRLKNPSDYDIKYGRAYPAEQEKIDFVIHLIESLQPQDAIEAALTSQFAISYIRGLGMSSGDAYTDIERATNLFRFGHEVLDNLTRYRTKGAQLINVQYNHNQAQINNFNVSKDETKQTIIEVI